MTIDTIATVGAITIICLLVGTAVKHSPVKDELIPVCVGLAGGLLGIVGMYIMPTFPADDILSAIAVGISSGLGSTGINQLYKQLRQLLDSGEKDVDSGNAI